MPPHSRSGKRGSGGADVVARQRSLYTLPLDEFTRARDTLARELASKGQAKAAQETRKLKRPVVAAWVVNQLVHQHPEDVEELLSSARALEKAHRKALSRVAPEALKEANRAFQRALDALMADVNALLAATGRPASGDLIRQVDETLRAASLGTEEERSSLSQGMLTRPLQPSGFGPFSQLLVVGPGPGAPRPGATAQVSHRPPAKAPAPPSTGGKVLQGPWAPRPIEPGAAPPAPLPARQQVRVEPGTRPRRAHEAKPDQRRREAEQRAELSKLRREARRQAVQAERAERRARREVELQEATLRTDKAKTLRARTILEDAEAKVQRAREVLEELEAQALHARQALERAEEAEQQQAEAVSRANAQAQDAEQALAEVRRRLEDAEPRLSR
ncbi:MAG: hypothetical protein JXB05_05690 [Myxococcaceae bacterium]|nr:hypothetical protein [Myxococcaceae bacterium]